MPRFVAADTPRGAIAKIKKLCLGRSDEIGVNLIRVLGLGNLGDVGGITEHNGERAHDLNVRVGVLGGERHEQADIRALLLEADGLAKHGDGKLLLDDALLGAGVKKGDRGRSRSSGQTPWRSR